MPDKNSATAHSGEGVTVTGERLAAAHRLYEADAEWQAMEQVFDELREGFPSNRELKAVLLKASVVNALYATNVFAIRAMARHICEVFSTESDPPDLRLVPRIAELSVGGKVRRHLSFASKYAHFFVDPDRFYILDYYAGQALAAHLGPRRVDAAYWTPDYPTFVQRVETLRRRDGITVSNRELDHYLWLYGCWRDHLRGRLASRELGETFKRADAELRAAFGE
jgi:hypothetical protein